MCSVVGPAARRLRGGSGILPTAKPGMISEKNTRQFSGARYRDRARRQEDRRRRISLPLPLSLAQARRPSTLAFASRTAITVGCFCTALPATTTATSSPRSGRKAFAYERASGASSARSSGTRRRRSTARWPRSISTAAGSAWLPGPRRCVFIPPLTIRSSNRNSRP